MKKLIISFLLILTGYCNALCQTVVGDSCIILNKEEAKVVVKMTEDLKLTKQELSVCDSIQKHKDNIICLQDSIINQKDNIINRKDLLIHEYKTTAKKKAKKAGFISGGIGIILGILLGTFI